MEALREACVHRMMLAALFHLFSCGVGRVACSSAARGILSRFTFRRARTPFPKYRSHCDNELDYRVDLSFRITQDGTEACKSSRTVQAAMAGCLFQACLRRAPWAGFWEGLEQVLEPLEADCISSCSISALDRGLQEESCGARVCVVVVQAWRCLSS